MISNIVKHIIMNTGNLISYKEFKKKATQSPSEEVFDSISATFNSYLSTFQDAVGNESSLVKCVSKSHIKVEKEDRMDLKVTVKIFLVRFCPEDINSAVFEVMEELGICVIDMLILSLPALQSDENLSLDHIKPLWIELEKLVQDSKVLTIGISDLDADQLAELYNWTQVKPGVNQVNLESCCVMPQEMTAFALDNDIQLLTHNDPKVLLSEDKLEKILEPAISSTSDWKVSWIVRYSVVVRCRGIIQNKGYLLSTIKDS